MSFFGPGTLSGYSPTSTQSGLDPQLVQALMAQFPGLAGLGQQGQQGQTLQGMGYTWPGPTLFQGQGTGQFSNLSPFESAGGASPESITGGLAMGTFGKSSSQQPIGAGGGNLSLPQLTLPMAQVAATQGGYGGGDLTGGSGQSAPAGGSGISGQDILGAGNQALNYLTGQGQTTGPQAPGMAEQRAGERTDYTNATGSPSGIPQLSAFLQASPGASTTPVSNVGSLVTPMDVPMGQGGYTLPSGTTFSMPQAGETMSAPGGSAQFALGSQTGQPQSQAPQGDILGGGISALQGAANLAGGIQSGNLGQGLGGLGALGGGLGAMFPAQTSALSQSLGLGAGGLGLAAGGAGALGAGFGLYQAIQSKDPAQIATSLASLYGTTVPVINSLLGTSLPTLTEAAGQAIAAVAPEFAASIGIGTGAVSGGAAAGTLGAGVGAAAGELGAGVTGGIVAAPALAIAIASMVQDLQNSARVQSGIGDFKRTVSSIPGVQSAENQAPGALAQLNQSTTPEQALAALRQFNAAQNMYQNTGVEQLLKSGAGGPAGDFGPTGGMFAFPQANEMLGQLRGPTAANLLGQLRAEDILGKAGFTPDQIRQQTGNYLGPEAFALALSGGQNDVNQQGLVQQNANGTPFGSTFASQYMPSFLQGMGNPQNIDQSQQLTNPEQILGLQGIGYGPQTSSGQPFTMGDIMNAMNPGGAGLGGAEANPWNPGGMVSKSIQDQLSAIQPGSMEQGLNTLLAGYGGINPLFMGLGGQSGAITPFGQGLPSAPAPQADPFQQALTQYMQQLSGLQQSLPQLNSAAGVAPTSGMDAGALAALGQGGGQGGNTSSVDLQALLRQLGYIA